MRRTASLRLIITIAILFLANTNNLFAQDERVEEKNEAQYGLKAGINFA